jgi:hypothetical protein
MTLQPGEKFESTDKITNNDWVGSTGDLVYIQEKLPIKVIEKYHQITMPKKVVGAYSMNRTHYLVVQVSGTVRQKK